MSKVLVPIAPGFEEIEAITIIDVLRRAGIEVLTVGIDRKQVMGAHGVQIKVDAHIEDVRTMEFDMLVLPGGMPGSENLANNEKVLAIIGQMDQAGKHIGAICAAPMALAKAGVIKSAYTCYPSFETRVGDGYIPNENVVSDQNIVTAKGPIAAIEFSLALIERLEGSEKADTIKKQLLMV